MSDNTNTDSNDSNDSNDNTDNTDLSPELQVVATMLRTKFNDLKVVAGNAAERRAVAVADLRTSLNQAVIDHDLNVAMLAELKTATAASKIASDEAVRDAMKNDGGPSNADIKASRAALLKTMDDLGIDTSDLVSQSLAGNVMGSSAAASPFYVVKNNGERSYRNISAIAAHFGISTKVLKDRLSGNGVDTNTGEAWETQFAAGNKVGTIGHVDVTDEPDTDNEVSAE